MYANANAHNCTARITTVQREVEYRTVATATGTNSLASMLPDSP